MRREVSLGLLMRGRGEDLKPSSLFHCSTVVSTVFIVVCPFPLFFFFLCVLLVQLYAVFLCLFFMHCPHRSNCAPPFLVPVCACSCDTWSRQWRQ